MEQKGLPLPQLFNQLRQADMPLGVEEYELLITALKGGFGLQDLDSLFALCKTLWIKSNDDLRIFERIFSQVMQPEQTSSSSNNSTQGSANQESSRTSTGSLLKQSPSQTDAFQDRSSRAEQMEQQAVQAILHMASEDQLPYKRFVRSDEYFPVTRRQMKQSWRHLRQPVREGAPVELDVNKTVKRIERQGLLLEPVVVPRHVNRVEMLLLIDQGGSMTPFHPLSARLIQTAQRGGRLTNIGVYYFRNYPAGLLFRTPSHQKSVPLQAVLESLHYSRSSVLIFSDAGAARGHFSRDRYEGTKTFLRQLTEHVRYKAWLNPMPAERWIDSTAQSIEQFIPMFDISRRGLESAINVLRGHAPSYVDTRTS